MKARFSEHRRPSSSNSEVAKHIHTEQPDHNAKMENTRILTTESRWVERGGGKAIFIKTMNTSLNRDSGRYCLPPVWEFIIERRMRIERMRGDGGPTS